MTSTNAERIGLRSPAALCCAVPHLLGFQPHSSAVILWLEGGSLLLTQRLDLPATAAEFPGWIDMAWRHPAALRADEVIVVVVTDREAGDPERELAEAVRAGAAERGVVTRDIVAMSGDRWTSLLCRDAACCPPGGHSIPEDLRATVTSAFAPEGAGPVGSREELLAGLARDESRARRIAGTGLLGQRRWRNGRARERWRESALANLLQWVSVDAPGASDARCAHLLVGLRDIRVRDTVLWEVSQQGADGWRTARRSLITLLQAAPAGDTAPVATSTAVVLWLLGDGVRARCAVERALLDDSGYSLALLLQRSLDLGLHPDTWTEAMRALSRDVCRHGDALQSRGALL